MDTSSFSAVGEHLESFLTDQFTPPVGTQTVLGYFGYGLPVEPASFISDDGKYNPARVNLWLNISLDVINSVASHRVGSPVLPATQLMDAICGSAMSTAPVGSDIAKVLARMRSQVMENLGGDTAIQTSPLNWYDPAGVAHWPKYEASVGSGSPPVVRDHRERPVQGTSVGSGSPPVVRDHRERPVQGKDPIQAGEPPLWTWRSVPRVTPEQFIPPQAAPMVHIEPHPMAVAMPKAALNVRAMHAEGAASPEALRVKTLQLLPGALQIHKEAAAPAAQTVYIPLGALSFNQAAKTASDQASVKPVDAQSISLELSYCIVDLSRARFWNDLLVGMTNWYVPGQRKNSWIGASTPDQCFGLPIALILTANVQIKAAWLQADRTAAANSSHVGPWSLAGSQISDTGGSGEAVLLIPAMQAIACIYHVLPGLPPQDDPTLGASPAPTVATPAAGGAATAAAQAEEQTEFTVILAKAGDEKINVIKEIRTITGLGLKEAKDLVEGAPKTVKEGVNKDEAAKLRKQLEDQGASVEIR